MAASRGGECEGWPLRVAVMPGKYMDFRQLFSMLTLDACCQISYYPLERHWVSKGKAGGTNFKVVSLPYRSTPLHVTDVYADLFKSLPCPPTRTTMGDSVSEAPEQTRHMLRIADAEPM